MQISRLATATMFLSLLFHVLLFLIIRRTVAHSPTHWHVANAEPELVELQEPTLVAGIHIRQDFPTNSSDNVIQNKPTNDDKSLTWDRAVGKGKNILRLLDTDDLSGCGVLQSNFTKWEALEDNGWSKRHQGAPKGGSKNGIDWRHAAENLKLSTDDDKNIQYDYGQFDNITLDGTNYQSSGGLYSNVMNTEGGIFALQGFSPRMRSASQKPPLDGSSGRELVPLQTWADITFLEWVDACKGDEKCIKSLTTVTKCHTTSNATMQIGSQALGGSENWAAWPGQSFSNDSQQFAALMSTPAGRGVAWLLLTHREQLGWKKVRSIDLWAGADNSSESNYYTFALDDHAELTSSHTRLTRSVEVNDELKLEHFSRDSQGNGSSILYDNDSVNVNYGMVYASDHNYSYGEAQKVGGYLVNLTQSSAEQSCVQQSQWKFSDFESNGWNSSTTELNSTGALDTFQTIISEAKLSLDDENTEHTVWEHATATQSNGTTYPATHARYDALYSRHVLFVLGAFSPASTLSSGEKALLPPLKALSDILWLQWADWAKAKKTSVENFRFFGVYQLTNPDTARIITQVFDGHEPAAYPGKSFAADSKELCAVLASPHGQGVVWLLNQHKSDLGTKTVKSVHIWNDERPCLLFEVENIDANAIPNAADGDTAYEHPQVQNNLSARANSWDDAVSKGKEFLNMLNCGSGKPSEFDKITDLEQWGWQVDFDMPFQYMEDAPSYKLAIEYLGVSYSEQETFQVVLKHSMGVTVDGTTYLPTNAEYSELYAPEFIICQTNWSPRIAGSEANPPMEGPFPKLERQSDVMFLEYQHKMANLKKPMTGLKGMLRAHVVNKETQAIVARALGMRSWDIDKKPSWPGRDFDTNSDEAAAILASPNGRAPVWFLATHKDQLGQKTISKVKVFSEGVAMHILFSFEDVESDSSDDEDGGVRLQSRQSPPAMDSAWTAAVETGNNLLDMLSCGGGPQSTWTEYDDLAKWGWSKTDEKPIDPLKDEGDVVKYLNMTSQSSMTLVTFEHNATSDNNGVKYPPTHGHYSSHYEAELIVGTTNFGPNTSLVPMLHQLSDVWFLEYSQLMNNQKKPLDRLKGVLRYRVANAESLALLYRAMKTDEGKARDDPPTWPGADFHAGSEEFAALLSSPNGRAVAWLLLNHERLGRKMIDSVRVWYDSDDHFWLMLFVIKDLSEDSQEETKDSPMLSDEDADVQRLATAGVAVRVGMPPEKYQALLEKGKKLVSALQSDEDCYPQSDFTKYEELADWGWVAKQDFAQPPMRLQANKNVFDFLDASFDANVNQLVVDRHDRTVQKDGKTYYRSGATYSNHYNPSVIIAKVNFGPAYHGPKQQPRVTGGADDPFPPLSRLSDVLFLEFQRVMAKQKQPMDELKGIWRDHIVNQDTKDVAMQITDADGDLRNVPSWPGVDLAAGSDEFAALLATPNGVGVAYFVIQHQEQLGQATIASAKVWYDTGLNILFVIEDKEGKHALPPNRRRSMNPSETGNLSQRFANTEGFLNYRALNDETYNNLTDTGKALGLALQSTGTCITQSQWTADDSLNTWGWNRVRESNVDPVSSFNVTKQVYDYVGASSENHTNHRASDMQSDKKVVDGITYYGTGARFDSLYNPAMIVVADIHGVEYQGKTQDPPVTGDPNPYPKLKFWSDVTFLEYQKFMNDSSQPMDGLKAIWHSAVVNPGTLDLASRLCSVRNWTDVPDWPGKDFEQGTDEFAALIASDNGKGVVYLLLQHREQLGSGSITNVRIWKGHTLQILYTIDDTCAVNTSLGRKTPGHLRRADEPGSQRLNEARGSGKYLLMAQNSDTKTLEECMSIRQSTFTETKQLDDFGWTQLVNRPMAVEEEKDEAIFNSWRELNLDVSENGNQVIEYQHLDESKGSDGTVYYPSGAYYESLFNEGGIVALDNASPRKMGPEQDPPVDGSRTKPFPPLRQWSDAIFPIYKEYCQNDPVRMKKLKAVLQQMVINPISMEVLEEYMDKSGDLVNGQPKAWPGTDYDLSDDGFTLALGIPNGKGIAYLLATHRDSLGWKEVYKVRIFSVGWTSPYNILYFIRDHEERNTQPESSQPESYTPNMERGTLLYCQLFSDSASVPQSPWVNYGSLEYYGWSESVAPTPFDDETTKALEDLGLSADRDDNPGYSYVHEFESKNEGHDYPRTGVEYTNAFNVKGGAIIAKMNDGPAASYWGQASDLVPLRQYSDVVFLGWQKAAGDNIKNLKYIIRHSISNEETDSVLEYVLSKRNAKGESWPGTHIAMPDRDALAVLGTPNGRGAAWLLNQHKEQLGLKRISGVTIFQTDPGIFSLCFYVEDIDRDTMDVNLPPDLQNPPTATQAIADRFVNTSADVTDRLLSRGMGERLATALVKRVGNAVKNLWTELRLM